jgi:fibronectin-binding autotransporter adhesin
LVFTAGGGVTNAASEVIPDTATVKLVSSAAFNLNNLSETVKSISGTGGSVTVGTGTLTLANPNGESYSSTITVGSGGKVVKNGTGTITLSGSNTNNGEIVLNNGTLAIGGNAAAGSTGNTGVLTINGGKLNASTTGARSTNAAIGVNLSGDFATDDTTIANPGTLTVNGGATIKNSDRTITVNSATLELGGIVGQDVAGRSLTKNGTGTLALNAVNTYSGGTTINGGMISVDGDGTLGNGSGTLTLNGGKLNTTADRSPTSAPIANPINVTADSAITTTSAAGTVGANLTTSSITGTSKLTFRNDAASGTGIFQPRLSSELTTSTPIEIANGANGTTELNSFNTTSTTQTFNGVISGTGTYVRNASTVSTGGTTVFTAANTYSGGTTVNRGLLLVNNTSGSGTGTGAVTVNTNGVLGGTGAIAGSVSIAGGTLSPGASVETLDTGALSFTSGGILKYEIDSSVALASAADLINANGGVGVGLSIASGSQLTLADVAATPVTVPVGTRFTMVSYSGTWNNGTFNGAADDSVITLGGDFYVINYNDTNPGVNFGGGSFSNYLTLTAVPEVNASRLGCLVTLVVGLAVGRRKLHQRFVSA